MIIITFYKINKPTNYVIRLDNSRLSTPILSVLKYIHNAETETTKILKNDATLPVIFKKQMIQKEMFTGKQTRCFEAHLNHKVGQQQHINLQIVCLCFEFKHFQNCRL